MSRSRFLPVVALAALIASLAPASPAAAHDDLIASTPARDESLAAAPAEVSLRFSAEVMEIGAAVIVVDETGKDWVVGEPEIDADAVTARLDDGMPDAGYEIRWRVVSSDGHPISGLIPFTIGDGTPYERADAPPADGATPPAGSATTESTQSTQENTDALRVVLIGVGCATVAVALFALFLFIRRRRRASTRPDDGTS